MTALLALRLALIPIPVKARRPRPAAAPLAGGWPLAAACAWLALVAGCGAAALGGVGGASAPAGQALLAPTTSASTYETRRPAELSEPESRIYQVVASVARHVGLAAPETDGAVCGAARDIGRGLLPEGAPPGALIDFALRSHGLIDPPPHLLVAAFPEGDDAEFLKQLAPRLERVLRGSRFSRVGVAIVSPLAAPGQRRMVVALLEGLLRARPMPRSLRRGQVVGLELELRSGRRSLRLVTASPRGKILSRPLSKRGARHYGEVACKERGVYQVEVTGDGDHGTEVLANFPLYCDEKPPERLRYSREALGSTSEAELEREVVERTNKLRQEAGLPILRPSPAVARVARRHSEDMRDAQFVGHISPTSGSPSDRLRRGEVVHLVARENVARAYSVGEALSELMKSPAHRENILATDVTELGAGVALERGESSTVLYVTQNFIQPGSKFDPSNGPEPIYALVDQRRRGAGLRPLARDPDLARLAREYLDRVVRDGGRQAGADALLDRELTRFAARFCRLDGVLVRVAVLEGIARADELLRREPTHYGLAASRLGDELAVFVLMGSIR